MIFRCISRLSMMLICACAAPLQLTAHYCSAPRNAAQGQLEPGQRLALDSPREAHIAALLGLDEALAERALGPLTSERKLEVLTRLELARLEVGAMKAEVDCDGERTKQALDYLTQRKEKMVQGVTVASILTATTVGVAGVLLASHEASPVVQDVVGVAGASGAASLSLGSLYVSPTIVLKHQRNLLRDIWEGPETSAVYPPIVWAYLSRAEFSTEVGGAVRSNLLVRFCSLSAHCDDPHVITLVFGDGGEFDIETLRLQAQLLDKVKVEVDLEHQDFMLLADRLLH